MLSKCGKLFMDLPNGKWVTTGSTVIIKKEKIAGKSIFAIEHICSLDFLSFLF